MGNNLKERYIYAVTRHLPVKAQADVAKELDGLISEMLEERQANRLPSENDIKDVLAELGEPEELALKYCGDRRTALISGTYFLMYKHVLRIVLPIVVAAIIGLGIIGQILGMGNLGTGDLNVLFFSMTVGAGSILQIFTNAISAGVHAFAVITIIFAVLDYKKADWRDGGDMLSTLPEIPDEKMKTSPGESIIGIIMSIAVVVVLLGYPHIIAARVDGAWLPVADIAALRGLWLPIILWAIFGIGAEIVQLLEGRYTMRLAMVTLVSNSVIAICAIVIFGSGNIINPEFVSFIEATFRQEGAVWLYEGLTRLHLVTLGIILIAAAAETIHVFVKAFLARR